MADVAIIGVIALGAIVGWRKGFVLPLVALGGALVSIATVYAGPLNGLVPSGNAGLGVGAVALVVGGTLLGGVAGVLVGLIHRVRLLRAFDHVVGLPLGAATAAAGADVAPLGTPALDGLLSP